VGEGAAILFTRTSGTTWGFVDLKLPAEVKACLDFHALHWQGDHVWVVGQPGSVMLHSANNGASWNLVRTRQPLPLHGVYFADEQCGWAVGDLGSILATSDGGKTWTVQHCGGHRVAVL